MKSLWYLAVALALLASSLATAEEPSASAIHQLLVSRGAKVAHLYQSLTMDQVKKAKPIGSWFDGGPNGGGIGKADLTAAQWNDLNGFYADSCRMEGAEPTQKDGDETRFFLQFDPMFGLPQGYVKYQIGNFSGLMLGARDLDPKRASLVTKSLCRKAGLLWNSLTPRQRQKATLEVKSEADLWRGLPFGELSPEQQASFREIMVSDLVLSGEGWSHLRDNTTRWTVRLDPKTKGLWLMLTCIGHYFRL